MHQPSEASKRDARKEEHHHDNTIDRPQDHLE